ncbi:EAL domain-containing protein [Lysobacter korlensis]|uniref:EAL domain-containing protein n=1 Tax=Lysobacter korlensis TaxID=553636 RepID=A0ABV6RS62_9GAMM
MDSAALPSPLALLDEAGTAFVNRVVAAARGYLGAHVSFLAEVIGGEKVIRHTDGPVEPLGLQAGARFPLENTYCHRLLQGVIPEVIYDVRQDERARAIPLTAQIGIEAYFGVAVIGPEGRAIGTLCCINFDGDPQRRERDVGFMRFLAGLIGAQLEETLRAAELQRERHAAVRTVLDAGGPRMVFQPIVAPASGAIVGAEALARFDHGAARAPDVWFRDAWEVGLGVELELAAVRNALPALQGLPAHAFLSINASPRTLADPGFADAIAGVAADRIVVEITEHAVVEDYAPLVDAVARLRKAGVRVAIDDVGAGYASLRHVLWVSPDIVKLDMSLTRGIDIDPVKQALACGLMAFAARTEFMVVAEGVETAAEAEALHEVGVRYGQGYLFARPGALPPH